MSPLVHKSIDKLMARFKERAEKGDSFDIARYVHGKFNFNVKRLLEAELKKCICACLIFVDCSVLLYCFVVAFLVLFIYF